MAPKNERKLGLVAFLSVALVVVAGQEAGSLSHVGIVCAIFGAVLLPRVGLKSLTTKIAHSNHNRKRLAIYGAGL